MLEPQCFNWFPDRLLLLLVLLMGFQLCGECIGEKRQKCSLSHWSFTLDDFSPLRCKTQRAARFNRHCISFSGVAHHRAKNKPESFNSPALFLLNSTRLFSMWVFSYLERIPAPALSAWQYSVKPQPLVSPALPPPTPAFCCHRNQQPWKSTSEWIVWEEEEKKRG